MAQRTGCCNLPLHPGRCPSWLFPRMRKLGGVISEIIINEYGTEEYLKRLADPYFFQALGCVLGFDWHSSGLSTTVTGALKESVNELHLGVTFAGGKGNASRKTLVEIEEAELSTRGVEKLKYASRMVAKVDSSLVQDGYQLYHHVFIFTEKEKWAVIQQGMNSSDRYARRYHWLSETVECFVQEPHNAICSDKKEEEVLDMTSKESREARKTSVDIVNDNPQHLLKYFQGQTLLNDFCGDKRIKRLNLPKAHFISNMKKINIETLEKAYEIQPRTYEELISIKGVGAKTVRSLALISELVYGTPVSWRDPAKYSFAHGGKDGYPRHVDRELLDDNTKLLQDAIRNAKLGDKDKINALKRLTYCWNTHNS